MRSIVSSHWCLSAACFCNPLNPSIVCMLIPALSMSALNILSKHFGGVPRLPLRLVMTDAVRAICAEVLVCIQKQSPWRHCLDCCMSMNRGLDFVSLYNASLLICLGQWWVARIQRCRQWNEHSSSVIVLVRPMSHSCRIAPVWPRHSPPWSSVLVMHWL